ncbi:MAG: response regulator [Deltaproteobacteria bacterium]|nr:response regulator [Deltaproteobacteria bacterium]
MRITSTENNHTLLFVSSEESAEEGVALLEKNRVALVVSDLGLPDKDGVEFIINTKEYAPDTKRIILTHEAPTRDLKAVTCSGDIHKCVKRPLDKRELRNTVNVLVKEYEALRDSSRHHQREDKNLKAYSGR